MKIKILAALFLMIILMPFSISEDKTKCDPNQQKKDITTYKRALDVDDALNKREFNLNTKLYSFSEEDEPSQFEWSRAYASDFYATFAGINGDDVKVYLTYNQAKELGKMKAEGKSDQEISKKAENYLKANAYLELSKTGGIYDVKTTTEKLVYLKSTDSYLPVSEYLKIYGGKKIMTAEGKELIIVGDVKYDADNDVYCNKGSCVNLDIAISRGFVKTIQKEKELKTSGKIDFNRIVNYLETKDVKKAECPQ